MTCEEGFELTLLARLRRAGRTRFFRARIGTREDAAASDATRLHFAARRLKGERLIVVSNVPGPMALAAYRKRRAIECEKGAAIIGHGGAWNWSARRSKIPPATSLRIVGRSGGGRMYGVELYSKVCMAVLRDGLSQREAARRFGVDRGTVAKMAEHSVPPGYRQTKALRRPKLDAHTAFIDEILRSDPAAPKKRRHTIQRIFERLRDERGFDGGYTTVRDYVRPRLLSRLEAFVPLVHPPGHAQADFGEAHAILGGVERKVHFLVVDLPQSDAIFLKAYLAETAEAFCDGRVAAFDFFGGVPQSILYDNTALAASRILGDGRRERSAMFSTLQSHHLFKDRFGRPGKGDE